MEYANAACVADLSLGSWDQDDEWEMGGDHSLLPGGNLRLVAALAQDVPVFYGCAATRVEHGAAGVAVHCSGPAGGAPRTFCADVALLTLPLGVLKQGVCGWRGATS